MAADRYLDTKDLLVSALDQAGRPREKRAGAATLVLARAEAAVRGASEPPMGAARLAPWQVVSVGCALVGILLLMEPGRVTSPRPLAPVAGARPGTAVPGAVAQARKLVLAQAIGGPARPLPGQIRALDAAGPPGVTQAGSGRSLAPGALTDRAPQRVDGELLPSAEDGREVGARSGAPLGADGPAAGAAPGRSGATAVAASGETGNVRERRLLDIHLDAQGHLAPGVGQHGGLAAAPRRFAPNGSVAPAASSVPLNTLSPRLRLYAGRYLAALGGPR